MTPAPSSHVGTLSRGSRETAIQEQLSVLYVLAEKSPHVFGSPLGPFRLRGERYHLPRFVYFGPNSADDAVRLAIYAGVDGTDERGSRALAQFVERLARTPHLGHGLNLSFFPLVNPSGHAFSTPRNLHAVDLAAENWEDSEEREIALLRQDARVRGYHGFIRLESATHDVIHARINSSHAGLVLK